MRLERRHERLELRLLDERARRDDERDLRTAARGDRRRRAGREVEHRRHAPLGLQREEGDERCARRRQQHADAFALARPLRQHTAERIAGRDETAVAQGTHLEIVGDEVAAAVLVTRVEQRVEERRIDARGREHRLHHLVAERAAQRDATGAAGHTLGRRQQARRQDAHGNPRKQAPTDLAGQARERRELHTVDAHGQQRGLRALGNDRGPFVHLHQRSGRRDAAFRKNDAGRAGFHRPDHGADGERVRRIDRQRVDEHEERLRPPLLRDQCVDGEDRIARQECPQQQTIEK